MKNIMNRTFSTALVSTALVSTALVSTALIATTLFMIGCTASNEPTTNKSNVEPKEVAQPAPSMKTGVGVDLEKKVIRIGMLNDESGVAAILGKPYAVGKRVLAAEVNSGTSKLLPDGWKIELIEKDHGYNPSKSQQALASIKDDVLFVGTSFGTPPTMPLRPFLKKDNIIAFPASLSSQMAKFEHTPPIGTPYTMEAGRAMDFAIAQAGGADKVKAGIIYDQSDYGKDGHAGWKAAATKHGVQLVAERTIKPGQKDFTAEIGALKAAGATHILLTVLPSSTGPILGTAAKMKYMPHWIGNTPSWVDAFFAHPKLPPVVFTHFHWVSGMPFWGEKVPNMDAFLAAYEAHGKELHRPDFYLLVSYIQGRIAVEALNRAIDAKDLTRAGFLKALRSIDKFDLGGMLKPLSLKTFPYSTSDQSRILKPDFEKKSWTVVADYAAPAERAEAPAVAPPPIKVQPKKAKRSKKSKRSKRSKKSKKSKKKN